MKTYAYAMEPRHTGFIGSDGKPSPCWLWLGNLHPVTGYGQARNAARSSDTIPAHRLIFELQRGPIPERLELDHLCRVRRCVNPEHLEPVTRAENAHRSSEVCRLDWPIVRAIRSDANADRSGTELAQLFGVNQSTVSRVRNFKTWREPTS